MNMRKRKGLSISARISRVLLHFVGKITAEGLDGVSFMASRNIGVFFMRCRLGNRSLSLSSNFFM